MGLFTIQQQITAGGNFDGSLPPGTPTAANDLLSFAPHTAGGLFDFDLANPAKIAYIEIAFGGQSSWSLSKLDVDGDELVLWAGTTDTSFVTLTSDSMYLFEKQLLLLRTVGAASAMKARISVEK